jgi:hypothetical protein
MNTRHSSNTPNWITPPWILEAVRKVSGKIDFDPASCEQANKYVQAQAFITEERNGLTAPWRISLTYPKPRTFWLNPPGGKTDAGESRVKAFWNRLLRERQHNPEFGHAMFLAFSIETTQITQLNCANSLLDFPTCFFKRRVAYIHPVTEKPTSGMTHSSCVTYIPGRIDRSNTFIEVFGEHGKVVGSLRDSIIVNFRGEEKDAVCDDDCIVPSPPRRYGEQFGVGIQSNGEGPLP